MDIVKAEWQDWGRYQWIPWGNIWNWLVEGIWFYIYLLAGKFAGTRSYGLWRNVGNYAFWKAYYPIRLWR